MKDSSLSILHHQGEDGKLYVYIYHGKLHVGTVEVNSFNCMKIFRGMENRSPVIVQYLQKEAT